MASKVTYADSGVDVGRAERFVGRIKALVGATLDDRVVSGVGGFAALYKMDEDRLLASGADGVGTKIKVAQALGRHRDIGIDLVAMCVNDILCVGAKPLFFLDYLAAGRLDPRLGEEIIRGIVEGCRLSGAALVGGETAEMPGLYAEGEYDLAGFAVGEVAVGDVLDGSRLREGTAMVALSSSGLHSNGFSLVRKLIGPDERDLLAASLEPTRIYVDVVGRLRAGGLVSALAHITGGGLRNIERVSESFDYPVEFLPPIEEIHPLFRTIAERSALGMDELYGTFNMGMGMVVFTEDADRVGSVARECGLSSWLLGRIVGGTGKMSLPEVEKSPIKIR